MQNIGADLFSKITRARQLTESYCGAATVQMLLSHYGVEVQQNQVVEAAGVQSTVEEHGMSMHELAKAVKILAPELRFWVKRYGTISDLKKILREYNYPVGFDWQGIFEVEDEYNKEGYQGVTEETMSRAGYSIESNDGEHGHFCVAVDIDTNANYIQIADPYGHYADKPRFIRLQEFLSRWWDQDVRVDPQTGKKTVVDEYRSFFLLLPKSATFPDEMGMLEL